MRLHWHEPKHSMHGDTVELVAPCGRYLIEFGMAWSGGYYVACCDHIQEENCRQWEAVFPTAEEAKAYAQRRVDEERWISNNQIFVKPCGDPACVEAACVRRATEREEERWHEFQRWYQVIELRQVMESIEGAMDTMQRLMERRGDPHVGPEDINVTSVLHWSKGLVVSLKDLEQQAWGTRAEEGQLRLE